VPTRAERQPPPRIQIEHAEPIVDCGRYPAKRTAGDAIVVSADIFRDGHEVLRAVVRWRGPGETDWHEAPMRHVDAAQAGVRWEGSFTVREPGRWTFTIEAWTDAFASWREELDRKVAAGVEDLSGELSEGVLLLERVSGLAEGEDRVTLERALSVVRDTTAPISTRAEAALALDLRDAARRSPDRLESTILPQPVELDVDRERARFGSWYELFPRSWGGFEGVRGRLPRLAELGFDVLYLPPIHPIGLTNRKGANNALVAGPGDPGSPWAIGDATGGHDAIHPDLGTLDEFDTLVAEGRRVGVEICLDFAIQCSADHPWLTDHPQWFNRRPDGTLKYAENPPKKYQDIYNVNWQSEDWRHLWQALLDVVLFWVTHGVRVFRVDNPHTKPIPFWEWLIRKVRAQYPDVVFLAEAFTRRAMMRTLGKAGFSQSYTYFTWKSSRFDLTEYVEELSGSGEQEYFRPNFFVNTPDILTEELQVGGPAKFASRLVLAATLSPSYGIYSGYEHFEHEPVAPGSEEYLGSEKYQLRERDLDGPLMPLVGRLNAIRRAHPALREFANIRFLETENDALIAYAKRTGDDVVITVVSLDPGADQEGVCIVPSELGLPPSFAVRDELVSGSRFHWRLGRNFVRLAPGQAHVLGVEA
jgi:starch synthase (maltosyl-transferring)